MKRKQLIRTLALALVFVSLPVVSNMVLTNELATKFANIERVMAVEYVTVGKLTYDVYEDHAVVHKGFDSNSPGHSNLVGDIVIESVVNGVPVTEVGEYAFAFRNPKITSVTLPSSIEVIGKRAFADCTGLKKITLNEGLKVIGDYSLRSATALDKLLIPSTVNKIGSDTLGYSMIRYMEVAKGASVDGINYQREFTSLDVLVLNSMPIYSNAVKGITTNNLIISKEDTMSSSRVVYNNMYYTENVKVKDNCLIDTESGDLIYFLRPDNENVTYLDISDIKGNIITNALRLGTDLKIIKAPKTWVDTQTNRPRVYFYDEDGVECLAAYSVTSGTSLAEEAKKIGTKWTKDSGSILGNITMDSTFVLDGELVTPEVTKPLAPILTASKIEALNREVGITVSLK